jgi:hypothetical protein
MIVSYVHSSPSVFCLSIFCTFFSFPSFVTDHLVIPFSHISFICPIYHNSSSSLFLSFIPFVLYLLPSKTCHYRTTIMKEMSIDTCYVMHIPDQIPSKLTDTKIVLKPHLLRRVWLTGSCHVASRF